VCEIAGGGGGARIDPRGDHGGPAAGPKNCSG